MSCEWVNNSNDLATRANRQTWITGIQSDREWDQVIDRFHEHSLQRLTPWQTHFQGSHCLGLLRTPPNISGKVATSAQSYL